MSTLLYIGQDGVAPSGVTTYGYEVLRHCPGARMLLLNCGPTVFSPPAGCAERIEPLPEAVSHSPVAVARALLGLVEQADGPVTILPNSGDTPWAATSEFLRIAPRALCDRVRVLGIVHSDTETQYALAERHHVIAPVWIGVSARCAAELRRRIGRAGVAVHESPYPVAIGEPTVRREQGPLRLAYVGRLEEPQKRVSRLLAVFAGLAESGVDFMATVVGDGPAAAEFRRALAAARPEIATRVRCTGALRREAVDEIWREHDVALLVSAFEGLPLALLEAMAAGVCPVAMAIESGLDELVRDGIEGRVVPQGDVAAMVRALGDLARDRPELRRMGAAGRERVAEDFSDARHFERLERIVGELWKHPAPASTTVAAGPDPTAAAVDRIVVVVAESGRPVAIYGAGMFGRKVLDACLAHGLAVVAVYDSDPARTGTSYRGVVCQAPVSVTERPEAVFVAASLQFAVEMAARIVGEYDAAGWVAPTIIPGDPGP